MGLSFSTLHQVEPGKKIFLVPFLSFYGKNRARAQLLARRLREADLSAAGAHLSRCRRAFLARDRETRSDSGNQGYPADILPLRSSAARAGVAIRAAHTRVYIITGQKKKLNMDHCTSHRRG